SGLSAGCGACGQARRCLVSTARSAIGGPRTPRGLPFHRGLGSLVRTLCERGQRDAGLGAFSLVHSPSCGAGQDKGQAAHLKVSPKNQKSLGSGWPSATFPRRLHVRWLIAYEMNRTEPSTRQTLRPPVCEEPNSPAPSPTCAS